MSEAGQQEEEEEQEEQKKKEEEEEESPPPSTAQPASLLQSPSDPQLGYNLPFAGIPVNGRESHYKI